MAPSLDGIFAFTELLNDFRQVRRKMYVNGEDRDENDVEHSYHLAMLAWYIHSSENLSLDLDKILRYSLVHDFVEVYAGDTYIYSPDQELLESKSQREKAAEEKLEKEWEDFPSLHETIKDYEAKADPESRFVYALDKMEPVLKIYLDGGRSWKREGVTLSMLLSKKEDKVKISPELEMHFSALLEILKKNEKKIFNS